MSTSTEAAKQVLPKRRPLPSWLVGVVIVATAGVTIVAMSRTGMKGPAFAWDRAHEAVEQMWGATGATTDDEVAAYANVPAPSVNGAFPVAGGFPGAMAIMAGVAATHPDRGVCTNCHAVMTQQGTPVPAIGTLSPMAHVYRGVCNNCHQMSVTPVAGSQPSPVPNAGFVPQMPAGVPQALPPSPAQPTEAEWQGLEVAPSPQGVLVAGAEGNAMRAGVLAGDLVASVNGASVASMADFVSATQNGLLAQGTIIVRRNGQRLAFELSSSPRNPAPPLATRPQTFQQQAGMAPAAMPYASPPVPQGGRF